MSNHPLRQWRKKNKVTLYDLAVKVKSTASSISRIERGLQTPSLSLMVRICTATNNELSLLNFLFEA